MEHSRKNEKHRPTILAGEWKHLLFLNYVVDPALLRPFIPNGTELDLFQGKAYVSLVCLVFEKYKLFGKLSLPRSFDHPQVNFRFYVKTKDSPMRHGVVFIKEHVPSTLLAFLVRKTVGENYVPARMKHRIEDSGDYFYSWNKNVVQATTRRLSYYGGKDSLERFLTERPWSFRAGALGDTRMLEVSHPTWKIHSVQNLECKIDGVRAFGSSFASLFRKQPSSMFVAEGSPVSIYLPQELKQQEEQTTKLRNASATSSRDSLSP